MFTPFQRLHKTPQHALAILAMNKYSFLSPGIDISFFAKAVKYEFPRDPLIDHPGKRSKTRTVTSSLCLADLSLTLKYTSPLLFHPVAKTSPVKIRPLLDLSIHVGGLNWSAIGTKVAGQQYAPTFVDNSLVGIIYKVSDLKTVLQQFVYIPFNSLHIVTS